MPLTIRVAVDVDERIKRLMLLLITYQHKRFRNIKSLIQILVEEEAARVWTPAQLDAHLKESDATRQEE